MGTYSLTDTKQTGNGAKILVVDDSRETIRHLVESLLPTFGFKSSYALDGRAALEKIRQETPDLVMLDLNLPQMTGIDVLEALALEAYQPPVVLMTGGGSEQSAVDAFRLGVKDYLVKPFTVDEVLETINRTLEKTRTGSSQSAEQLDIARNELRRQRELFRHLISISKSITSLTDLNTIIDRVLHVSLQQCDAERSMIWIPTHENGGLTTYQYSINEGNIQKHNTPIYNHYVSALLKNGHIIREAEFSTGLEIGMERKARSIMYAPLKVHNENVGVVGVCHLHAPHAFSEMDEMFFEAIAEYASIALSNTFAIQKSRSLHAKKVRDLYNLVSLTNAVASQPTAKIIQDALFYAYNRWQIEACSIWLVNEQTKTVDFYANMGFGTDELNNTQIPLGEGFVGYVAETGKWIYSNAVAHHPRHYAQIDEKIGFETRSMLCIPLVYQGNILGALQLLNRMDGDFVEKDVEQAHSLATIISIAVYNRPTLN